MHKPDYENLYCETCGEKFKNKGRLARHIQKWNSGRLANKILNRKK